MKTSLYLMAACALRKSKIISGTLLMGFVATGCVDSPLPVGCTAVVYAWENRTEAITSRTALSDQGKEESYAGDFVFSDVLETNPEIAGEPSLALIIKACQGEICYYAVVFPEDYSLNEWNLVGGEVSLTGLSTSIYHQVKELPAGEVRARLNELTDLLLSEDVEQRSYASLLALNVSGAGEPVSSLRDGALPVEAERLVSQGEQPMLMVLINAGVKNTSELSTSRDFVFSDSWDLKVDVDISARTNIPSYLMICSDFERRASGYKVAYNNCALKTNLVGGRFESTLRMTGNTRELLVTIMPLENLEALEQTVWVREGSDDSLGLR